MSSFGRPPHWDSILIRTPPISSSNMSKTGKIQKIRYIYVINKKSVILKKSKIDFKSTGSVPVTGQFATGGNISACLLPVIHAIYEA